MKIGLYLGTGFDGGGVGSLHTEWLRWAKNEGNEAQTFVEDFQAPHYLKTKGVVARAGSVTYVKTGSDQETVFPADLDLLVIMAPPKSKESIEPFKVALEKARTAGAKILYLHVEYTSAGISAKAWFPDLSFFDLIDTIWIQGSHNPFVTKLEEMSPENAQKIYIGTCQFLSGSIDEYMASWLPVESKHLSQVYWQSRPVEWKGFVQWLPVKRKLKDAGLEVNSMVNGIAWGMPIKKALYGDPHIRKEDFYELEDYIYHTSQKDPRYFPETIEPKTHIYKQYDRAEGLDFLRRAGFAGYYTMLDPSLDFFPENAVGEIFTSGTLAILPDWYFDGSLYTGSRKIKGAPETTIIPEVPSEVGMLAYNHETNCNQLADTMQTLMADGSMYDQWRQSALNWVHSAYNANKVVAPVLKELGLW